MAAPAIGRYRMSRGPLISLLLAAITLGVYARALRYDFVNFDDHDYVVRNARVLDGLTLDNVGVIGPLVDGAIIGTSIKKDGVTANPVDPQEARAFVRAWRSATRGMSRA